MKWFWLVALATLFSCIGEDILMDEVDPEIRITNAISTMEVNTSYQFEYTFLNNVGIEVDPTSIIWQSSDMSIMTINSSGLAMATSTGTVELTVSAVYEEQTADVTITFEVTGDATMMSTDSRSGSVITTSTYRLTGDFTLSQDGADLIVDFDPNYDADTRLPGLYVYLTNNPNSPTGGYEIGAVTTFNGAHQYIIPNTGLQDFNYIFYYCKPFKVKVGHGDIN